MIQKILMRNSVRPYRLPFKANGDYSVFMQKQPGKDKPLYIIRYGKEQEEFFLREDTEKHFII